MARRHILCVVTILALVAPAVGRSAEDPLKPEVAADYELHKLLVDTINQVERNYVKPIDRRKLVEAAIQGVLRELDDYSGYVPPEQMSRFKTSVSHKFEGIGIQVGMQQGQLSVISPMVGTPAYRAGMLAGDRILEIDGKSTKGLSLDEATKRLKGEIGTQVVLKVTHPGRTKMEDITLRREEIQLETVLGDHRSDNDRWDYLLDDEPRIGYVRITGFGGSTAKDLRKTLDELKQEEMAGLVLDLRFNPGGLLSSAIQVSDLFVSEGKIVSTAGRNVKERVWKATKRGTYDGFPMAILVNRYSASASEIVSACLQDHDRAVVVGERTYGKGSVQQVIELEAGQSALKLTTAGYHRPNGKNIDRLPGATPEDEWGVLPNDGFELKLDHNATVALARNRRQRDILKKDEESGDASDSDEPAEDEKSENEKPEPTQFVDQQLKMATDYLRKQLIGRTEEPSEDEPKEQPAELAQAEAGADVEQDEDTHD